jgi:shikimate kinase
LNEGIRGRLAGQTVVFLSVELSDAVKRVGLGAGRPLLSINPRATLKFLMEQRRPLYASVATHTIATDGRDTEEIAAELAALLKAA